MLVRSALRRGGLTDMFDVKTLSGCRYATPQLFETLTTQARRMGFMHAACGPLARSDYHAGEQAQAVRAQRPPAITNN